MQTVHTAHGTRLMTENGTESNVAPGEPTADVRDLIESYLSRADWRVKENANMDYSLQGLNQHIITNVTKDFWLHEIYTDEQRRAHVNADFHIHDLNLLAPIAVDGT